MTKLEESKLARYQALTLYYNNMTKEELLKLKGLHHERLAKAHQCIDLINYQLYKMGEK